LLWLSEGDAPTKFFHVHANARRRRKFIRSQCLLSEESKAEAVFQFFHDILGVKIRLQKRSNVIISLGVCNQIELYQELEID
jgi:hypothetical protein